MKRRGFLASAAALAARPALAQPAIGGKATTLVHVPQGNLVTMDAVWTTAQVTRNAAGMVFETLYGRDEKLNPQPQMVAGHEVTPDGLRWTMKLRDGLVFHDGEKVLARDCVASIRRWGSRDSFGQVLMRTANEVVALDDKRFQFRLKKPCPQLLFGLGARQSFVMPERIASRPGTEQITDAVGSGPFRFLRDEWVSGVRAAYAKFDGYVPRQEPASFFAGGKAAYFDRVEWIVQPDPSTAAAALQKNEADWIEQPLIDLGVALGVAVYLVIGAWSIGRTAIDVLMDRELPESDRKRILSIVSRHPSVRSAHDLRTRSSGLTKFIQLHVVLEPTMSLGRAHIIGDSIQDEIQQAFPEAEIILHIDPWNDHEPRTTKD